MCMFENLNPQAGEEREGGKASDSAVASSNTRRGGGPEPIKVILLLNLISFVSTYPTGASSGDC